MDKFKVIIVEDDKLELKGTQQILQTEVPEAEIIGTASGESDFWKLMRETVPDLVLLDLGLGGSTTVGVDICRQLRTRYADMKILVFTGEIPARCIQAYRTDLAFYTNGRSVCLTELKGYQAAVGQPVIQPRRPNSRLDKVRHMFQKVM